MICPICKSNIRDDAVFCPVCGKPVPQNSPNIHNIETVELPKQKQRAEHEHPVAKERTSVGSNASSDSAAGYEPVSSGQLSDREKGPTPEGNRDHSVKETARRESFRHENAAPRQPERPSPNYRDTSRHGAAAAQSESESRQNARRNGQMRYLSEKETFRVRNNLSKKAQISFIFAIFGLCAFTLNLPCAIIGLVFSIIVRNEYRDRDWKKDTDLKLANAAFVCSIIGIVLGVIGIIILMISGAGIIAALTTLASWSTGGNYYGF